MIDTIKIIIVAILGSIYSYLEPIHNPMKVLAFVFATDIILGVLVDLIKNNDRIRLKKLLIALAFLALYLWVIASTYIIGELMNDKDEALFIIKSLTYVFAFFYISNTTRNLRLLVPDNKPIAFLDYWLGLQVIKRLPDLAVFLGLTDKKENDETNK